MKGMRPASGFSRAATFSWIAAAIASTAALVAEQRSLIALALAPLIAVGLIALSRRKKAAIAPGAFYASSADLVGGGTGFRRQIPGELSFTDDAVHWNPSRYSIKKGAGPITIELSERPDIVFEAGPSLSGVFVRIHRLDGSDLTFITHRTRGLGAAMERLDSLLRSRAAEPDQGVRTASGP